RFSQYQAHQMKVQSVWNELQAAQQRQAYEYQNRWEHYSSEQDRLFAEKVPEFRDDGKRTQLQKLTVETLERDYGFTPQEMAYAWQGAFRDHRVQQLLLDAARYRQLKKNPPKPAGKPLPPVQRPGVASASQGGAYDTQIKALEGKQSLSLKEAAKLHMTKRASKG